ncbi:MAG: hypothetical protein SFV17_16950 [Candidatus Obscuribacter sp.]|nr:hypothetical protein [Candidatus Melainabacteria bacterium]MDX1988377.1 hypothetical protein [Candidatus Obscuribacter sp.]
MAPGNSYLKTVLVLGLTLISSSFNATLAGPNDFFGSSIPTVGGAADPGSSGAASSSASELTPQSPSTSGQSDYTDDEKRMQKKYKFALKHAQALIARADKMIKDGESRKDNKMLKKGQILKGIGERTLENLKASNPLPEAQNALKDKQ